MEKRPVYECKPIKNKIHELMWINKEYTKNIYDCESIYILNINIIIYILKLHVWIYKTHVWMWINIQGVFLTGTPPKILSTKKLI